MKKIITLSLCALSFLLSAAPPQEASLAQLWQREIKLGRPTEQIDLTASLQELSELHVIFAAGFLSEGIPGYFADNEEVLSEEFHSTVSHRATSSFTSIESTSHEFAREIRQTAKEQGRAIVLIGHSKGGGEALNVVLRHPSLILEGTINRVILIQAAIGGSPVAEFANDRTLIGHFPGPWREGLMSLHPTDSHRHFSRAMTSLKRALDPQTHKPLTPQQIHYISQRIFYVRSYQRGADMSALLRIPHAILKKKGMELYHDERNDGLLLVRDQMLEGIGVDLGVLYADHADLTVSNPLQSNSSAEERLAFTRALMKKVFAHPLSPLPRVAPESVIALSRPFRDLKNLAQWKSIKSEAFAVSWERDLEKRCLTVQQQDESQQNPIQQKMSVTVVRSLPLNLRDCAVEMMSELFLAQYFPSDLPFYQQQFPTSQRSGWVLAAFEALKNFLRSQHLSPAGIAQAGDDLARTVWRNRPLMSEEDFALYTEGDESSLYILQDLSNSFRKVADAWAQD